MKEELIEHIEIALKGLGIENPKVSLDTPIHEKMGDYSTSAAMAYAKQLDRKPLDLAGEIKETLEAKHVPHISKIDVVAPGFINFFFDTEFFGGVISDVLGNGE